VTFGEMADRNGLGVLGDEGAECARGLGMLVLLGRMGRGGVRGSGSAFKSEFARAVASLRLGMSVGGLLATARVAY
jgi:hypothetical protein